MKIAVMQFPGTNCEHECLVAVRTVGMDGELFRWNQPATELSGFDGYIITGGFSYQDRVRAGALASKEPVIPSVFDGFGMGIGFTFGLCLTAAIRELFGSGTLYGFDVLGFKPLLIMILPAGGFFVIGFIMATFNWIEYLRTGKVPRAAGGH